MLVSSRISSTLSVQQADQGEKHIMHSAAEHRVEHDLAPCVHVLADYPEFLDNKLN
jgi:hypothetical protein